MLLTLGTSTLIGAIIGLITGGPPGMAAGAVIGAAAPTDTPGGLLAVAYFSRGPKKCMCFPLDCTYDESQGKCAIKPPPSHNNPFAFLPFPGTKCGLNNKTGLCSITTCTPADYS